jgi:hypothetical protein
MDQGMNEKNIETYFYFVYRNATMQISQAKVM